MDPELPMVSIVDLGMVGDVAVSPDAIDVELLPTFIGCPALVLIAAAVTERLGAFGAHGPRGLAVRAAVDLGTDHAGWAGGPRRGGYRAALAVRRGPAVRCVARRRS